MNKSQVKKSINQNLCRTFTGANIQLNKGEKILSEDLIRLLRKLESDKDKFTSYKLGNLHGVMELGVNGLTLSWVMVPENQGNILASTESTFEQGMLQELEEKLVTVTHEVVQSIDIGNDLARESSVNSTSAAQILKRLHDSPNSRISQKVAARASGPQVSFAFIEGERQLGGNVPVPKEFTNTESVLLKNCRVVRWVNNKEVRLHINSLPDDQRLHSLFQNMECQVRLQQGTYEAMIINCAVLSEAVININVCEGLLLKNGKRVLQLSKIINDTSIVEAARVRLDELIEMRKG